MFLKFWYFYHRMKSLRHPWEGPSPNGGLRLNLGCGTDYRYGYVNIDSDPSARADLHLDFLEFDRHFSPDTVREVTMIHSLNYLNLWQARDLFTKIFLLLEPGGQMIIETVNLENAIRKISRSIGRYEAYMEGVRGLHAFGMVHVDERRMYAPNAFSWTPWHLVQELREAGYRPIAVGKPETHASWRDMRVEACKPRRVGFQPSQEVPGIREDYPRGKILFVFNRVLGKVTSEIRGLIFKELFEGNGWRVEFVDVHQAGVRKIASMAASFDAVYLLKVPYHGLIQQLKRKSKAKVVFDLTDALWKPHFRKAGWEDLEKILSDVDAVFSENEYICDYGRKFNPVVIGIPACTQVERFDMARRSLPPRKDGKVVIGWVGSPETVGALEKSSNRWKTFSRGTPTWSSGSWAAGSAIRCRRSGMSGTPSFPNTARRR